MYRLVADVKRISLTDFRSQVSGILDQVEQGESLMAMLHGQPVAHLTPISIVRADAPIYYPQPD
jgi:antitoxin (DNA-binding transcriptional repressor) of toxin-antitoxin stability system